MSHPPPFADLNNCSKCNCSFTLFNRKHHCRNCGNTFCHECSSKTTSLPAFNIPEAVRVCDKCYEAVKTAAAQKPAVSAPVRPNFKCTCNMPLCVCVAPKEDSNSSSGSAAPAAAPAPARKPIFLSPSSSSASARTTVFASATSSASKAKVDLSGDINEQCREAVKNGDVDLVTQLLKAGADARWTDRQGQSLLHMAALFNKTEICMLLLAAGADPMQKNGQKETVLDLALPALQAKIKNYGK